MSVPRFSVETRKQCVLLQGESNWLLTELTKEIENRGIKVFHQEKDITDDYDIDYFLGLNYPIPLNFNGIRSLYLTDIVRAGQIPSLPASTLIVLYPQLVGPHSEPNSVLHNTLTTIITDKTLPVYKEGLDKYYLLHEQDLVVATVEILFGTTDKKIIYLADPDSPSSLSFAYQVRSALPFKIELVFDQNKGIGQGPELEEYLLKEFSPNFRAADHIFSLVKTSLPALNSIKAKEPLAALNKSPLVQNTAVPERHLKPLKKSSSEEPLFVPIVNKTSKKLSLKKMFSLRFPAKTHKPASPWRNVITGIFVGVGLYLTSVIFAFTLTFLTSRRLLTTFASFAIPSDNFLSLASSSAKYLEINLVAISSLPGLNHSSSLKEITTLLSTYENGITMSRTLSRLSGIGKNLMDYILGGSELDINSLLDQAKLETGTLYEQLSLLDAELSDDPPSILPSKYSDNYHSLKSALVDGRRAALTGKTILGTAPDMLGLGSRRKYLVLFQNNMELRATGGFIGSFAILSFENGHLYDMPIYDVYSADGLLKGHVEPPAEIKKYLGEANWYLRDSNWDPDFVTSARRAEWFLKKTVGTDVQGTIGINLYTLSGILRSIGGIELTDYNEVVNADNIFERAEYHSEVNFFPGSTGKKEFLSSTASSVFNSLHNLTLSQTLSVVKAIAQGIDTKNTLISVSSPSTSRIFTTLGWDGSIRDPQCPDLGSSNCLADYAYLVESNFGVNKANYFLGRSISDNISLSDDGEISHHLAVTYTNKATSVSWPAGNYKNYVRLYLPAGTSITGVKVGENTLESNEFNVYAEHGKTVLGLLVEVPINSTLELAVDYRLLQSLNSSASTYSYYWQKQSGTSDDPYTIKFNYPKSFEPDIISPRATIGEGQLGFGLVNNTDRRITVKFK